MAGYPKWLWSRAASVVALLAVGFDLALHYFLPTSIAIQEGWAYFLSKYVIVEISAAVILSLKLAPRLRAWRPFLAGFVGSSAFGAFYYTFPQVSVEPGYLTLPYRLLWGVFHALVIWAAAAIVLRKPGQAALAFALLAVSIAVGLLVPLGLW